MPVCISAYFYGTPPLICEITPTLLIISLNLRELKWVETSSLFFDITETNLEKWKGKMESRELSLKSHSSVLAWRIPGMAEPGGLPSMGSHRVGHDWRDLAAAAAAMTNNASVNECKYGTPYWCKSNCEMVSENWNCWVQGRCICNFNLCRQVVITPPRNMGQVPLSLLCLNFLLIW